MKWTNKGHQFDTYGEIYKKRNRIFIYGAGEIGKFVCESIKFLNCVDGFIDTNVEKQKSSYCGLPVFHPSAILNSYDEKHLIIIAIHLDKTQWRYQIKRKLLLSGYIYGVDFLGYEDFIVNDFLLHIFAIYAHEKIYLSSTCFIPSTVCNLNCKSCLNFTPILNEKKRHIIKPFEQVKNELDFFFSVIDFTPRFQISGGEPLLYPQFTELVAYIGHNYRNKIGNRFETVLNGSVIPTEEQFEIMRANDMLAIVDNYTENVTKCRENRENILFLLKRKGVRIDDNSVPTWFDLDVNNSDNSNMSENDLINYFDDCGNPWNCYNSSRIYACIFANFAINAGILPDSENNYFHLSERMTFEQKKQFIEFILGYNTKGYVDLCIQCSGWSSINTKIIPVAEQVEFSK